MLEATNTIFIIYNPRVFRWSNKSTKVSSIGPLVKAKRHVEIANSNVCRIDALQNAAIQHRQC